MSEVATGDLAVPEQELRAVLIGAGGFGQIWWELHHAISGVRIVALVDREQDAMTSAGASLAVPAAQQFIRLEDALASGPIDIVIDSTPPDYHAQNALLAMQSGAHVFMAKPAASRWDDAVSMAQEADRAGVVLAVNEQFRFGWLPLAVGHVIEMGQIGRVESVSVSFREPSSWQGWRASMGHPLLLDAAVQHFDMVRAITGLEPEKVFCREWKRTGSSLSGFGSASAIFELTGGVPLIYNATWDQRGDYPATTGWWGAWRIQGSEGELRAEGKKGIWINGVSSPTTVQPLDVRALSLVVFDQFLRTIRIGSEVATSAWSDLKTLAMSEMAIRSAESGSSVTLSELDPSPYPPAPEDVEAGAGPVEIG